MKTRKKYLSAALMIFILVGLSFSTSFASAQSYGSDRRGFNDERYYEREYSNYPSKNYDYRGADYNSRGERYYDERYRQGYEPYGNRAFRYSGGSSGSYFGGGGFGAGYSSYQSRPSFNTYYGDRLNTYWPQLMERETCQARTDLVLNVAPAGCQPAVVRSDLLAEQNVPVFCQVDSLKLNPLIDIKSIRNIVFRPEGGNYPPEIVGTGFHPARAALRTYDTLLGSPLVNNVGYVVVVLKQQPDESKLPEFVNVTLNAQVDYTSGNAFGIGRTEFILQPVLNDQQWQVEKIKQSFWRGRYSVRLEQATSEFADISIYEGERKISSDRVYKDKISGDIFVPGLYCQAKLQIAYDGLLPAVERARIEVSSEDGNDVFDVEQGSLFLDDRCQVGTIRVSQHSTGEEAGDVSVACRGLRFDLSLKPKAAEVFGDFFEGENVANPIKKGDNYEIDLRNNKEESRAGIYVLSEDDQLSKIPAQGGEITILVASNGTISEKVAEGNKDWIIELRRLLIDFRKNKEINPNFGFGELLDKEANTETLKYFGQAIENYEQIADDYPAERQGNIEGGLRYGEIALKEGIELSSRLRMLQTESRLINKLLENYPDAEGIGQYEINLDTLSKFDVSSACETIPFDDRTYTICLRDLETPSERTKAELSVDNNRVDITLEERKDIFRGEQKAGEIVLDSLSFDEARISAFCADSRGRISNTRRGYLLVVNERSQEICGTLVELDKANVEEVARVRLIPKADGTRTQTSFSVTVGIEKRDIQLSPSKARQKIENLNKSIEKWEKLSDNLGNVVETMKGACFATAGVLTVKNFLTGLSGEAVARQMVMNGDSGWKQVCASLSGEGRQYSSLDECFLAKSSEIDRDVSLYTAKLNQVNNKIKPIQADNTHSPPGGIFGDYVDTEEFKVKLAEKARNDYGTVMVKTEGLDGDWGARKEVLVSEILSDENVRSGVVSTDAIRSIMLYSELQKDQQLSSGQKLNVESNFRDTVRRVNENKLIEEALGRNDQLKAEGFASAVAVETSNQKTVVLPVRTLTTDVKNDVGFGESVTHTASVRAPGSSPSARETGAIFASGTYILALKESDVSSNTYNVEQIYFKDENRVLTPQEEGDFLTRYGIGNIKSAEGSLDRHEIIERDRECKYYETEPYKGMPAVVPFDIRNGWYAGTRQSLPAFGGIGAFDASGRVTSFWLCNVGDNGRVEFESGFGDDLCQQINLNTGQPLGAFPGQSEQEARALVSRAVRAIEDASRQYGSQFINVGGTRCKVGKPSIGIPETQCQDFMSPSDCNLMFNVCDPVICPNSRCDLGGQFPVANVAQTGIAGSALLCLPNIKEGILIPVCLTGIKAGIDGWTSIMKTYRDCLQAHLDSGETIGLCDQVHSVYLCDFFWGQVAPFVNVLVPKLIESAYGQGVRGGGEYLTVNAAWQNMQNSVNYFTQSYAVNSLKAFQARSEGKFGTNRFSSISFAEIGGEFCNSFISAKAPDAFKSLIEPDSPPQFHAWFDARKFSDATVPATAQYKVFYHIYAGKDEGVNFLVYLKNPPESSYYASAPRITVDSGFIARGEYATETVDFTAPDGYKELCVRINNQEECGFGQVSTSFAVNYLRDEFVEPESQNKNIQSEEQCIGGTPNVGELLNPNIQSGVEGVINPQAYNRGIVRICSTQNPGISTNPERFADVGFCSDQKIRCWLDLRSVDNALTDSNLLAKNQTLEVLRDRTGVLRDVKEFTGNDGGAAIVELERKLENLRTAENKVSMAEDLLEESDFIFNNLVLNSDKAWLLLVKARINREVALSLYEKERVNVIERGDVEVPSGSVDEDIAEEDNFDESGLSEGGYRAILSNSEEQLFENADGTAELGMALILDSDFDIIEGRYYLDQDYQRIWYKNETGEFSVVGEIISNTGLIQVTPDGIDALQEKLEEINGALIEGYFELVNQGEVESCELTNAEWKNLDAENIVEAKIGEKVILSVDISNCGGSAAYEIFEDDIFVDDKVASLSSSGEQSVEWEVSTTGDSNSQPEFYFIVKAGEKEIRSGILKLLNEEIEEEAVEELAFIERFSVQQVESQGHLIFYRKTLEEEPKYTRLFIVERTKPLHYGDRDDDIEGSLSRIIEDLRVGEESVLTISSGKHSLDILGGEFALGDLDQAVIVRENYDSLVLIPASSGQAGELEE